MYHYMAFWTENRLGAEVQWKGHREIFFRCDTNVSYLECGAVVVKTHKVYIKRV